MADIKIRTARLISPTQIQSELVSLTPHFEWSSVVLKDTVSLNLIFDIFQTLREINEYQRGLFKKTKNIIPFTL